MKGALIIQWISCAHLLKENLTVKSTAQSLFQKKLSIAKSYSNKHKKYFKRTRISINAHMLIQKQDLLKKTQYTNIGWNHALIRWNYFEKIYTLKSGIIVVGQMWC